MFPQAIELLTQCYVLVQGNTVAAMGGYKGLKDARKIVIDCMRNIHPIYHIKELMIKRELAKDPALANENWDRFLPKFRRRRDTKKKRTDEAEPTGANAQPVAAAEPSQSEATAQSQADGPSKKAKKVYTPFPPPQQPRKVDLQIESGEYFLKPSERQAKEEAKRKAKQAEAVSTKQEERAKAFVAPEEPARGAAAAATTDASEKKSKDGKSKTKRKRDETA